MSKVEKILYTIFTVFIFSSALAMVLMFAFYVITPIEVTVEEASLGRLALVAQGNGNASVAYNISVAVAVRNPNWAMRVWRTGPLDAELRLAGQPFALVRLASGDEPDRFQPLRSKVYRVAAAAAKSSPVAIGSDAAAAFARESVVGIFSLELIVDGEFWYEAHSGSLSITRKCSLRLPLSTAPTAAAFARFERTLPLLCTDDVSNKTNW